MTGRSGDAADGGPRDGPELVVMVGLQASGKSTWVGRHLAGTHVVVSKDHWPRARRREARQRRLVAEALAAGRCVVVDNTDPAPEDRSALVALAREHGARTRAVFVDVPLEVCLARNAERPEATRVPLVGLLATRRRLVPPTPEEGFDTVTVARPAPADAGAAEPAHGGPVRG